MKKAIALSLISVILCALCSCSSNAKMPSDGTVNLYGGGNGYVVTKTISKQGNSFYYVNEKNNKLYRYDIDDAKSYCLKSSVNYQMIYTMGDYLFAKQPGVKGFSNGLVRIKTDGSNRKFILKDYDTTNIVFYNNKIYFLVYDNAQSKIKPGIYSSDFDGENVELLIKGDKIDSLFVAKQQLYYLSNGKIYEYDLKNTNCTPIANYSTTDEINQFCVSDSEFVLSDSFGNIEIIDKDGGHSEKIKAIGTIYDLFCFDNKIWYSASSKSNEIQVNTIDLSDKSEKAIKNNLQYGDLLLFDDGVYYCEIDSGFRYQKLS